MNGGVGIGSGGYRKENRFEELSEQMLVAGDKE